MRKTWYRVRPGRIGVLIDGKKREICWEEGRSINEKRERKLYGMT
jgi:hypothetical protein